MFRRIKELQSLVEASRKSLARAEMKISELEETQKDLRTEIEDEHLENYRNHKKLLAIEKPQTVWNSPAPDGLDRNKRRWDFVKAWTTIYAKPKDSHFCMVGVSC